MLLGNSELIEPMMDKTRDSYNVDMVAQGVAECALLDQQHVQANLDRVRTERARVSDEVRQLGLHVSDSETNFILIEHPAYESLEKLFKHLRKSNVLVRFFDTPRLQHALRVSIGTSEQNSAFLAALRIFQTK